MLAINPYNTEPQIAVSSAKVYCRFLNFSYSDTVFLHICLCQSAIGGGDGDSGWQ